MALARPGSQKEEQPCAVRRRDRAALVGLERDQLARVGFERLARGLDPDHALHDRDELVLLHLVDAQLLARLERDEDGSGLVTRVQDDRRAPPGGRLDLAQIPPAHAGRS